MKDKTWCCDCMGGEHYIKIIKDEEDNQIYIDLVTDLKNYSFFMRLKLAWKLITTGYVCNDGIILRPYKVKELIAYLNEPKAKNNES